MSQMTAVRIVTGLGGAFVAMLPIPKAHADANSYLAY